MTTTASKSDILTALERHISQRSGIDRRLYQRDWRDKEGGAAFMADYRTILRDGKDARAMLRYIAIRDSITADMLAEELSSGSRLSLGTDKVGNVVVDYCTGQYFAVEYRAATCRALASVVWHWLSDDGALGAEFIRKAATRELGRSIANRWFR